MRPLSIAILVAASALAADPPRPLFERDILPILTANCWKCHGGEGRAADLDMRSQPLLLSGGKSGRLRLRAQVTHLDTPITDGGETQVVYLNYASAKDLVPILQGVAATLTGEVQPGKAVAGVAPAAGAGPNSSTATIQAGEPLTYELKWTVPSGSWR